MSKIIDQATNKTHKMYAQIQRMLDKNCKKTDQELFEDYLDQLEKYVTFLENKIRSFIYCRQSLQEKNG